MGETEIFDVVRKILAEQLCVPQEAVSAETFLAEDLGADSLDTIELSLLLDEAFGIEIPDDAAEGVRTVGDLLRTVGELVRGFAPLQRAAA